MPKNFHKMEMRFVYGETLSELIEQNPAVMCLEADLSKASGTNPVLIPLRRRGEIGVHFLGEKGSLWEVGRGHGRVGFCI